MAATCAIVRTAAELSPLLAPRRRILGMDVGTKTIGLALSDPLRAVATPLETLRRSKFTHDAQALAHIIARHEIGALVVGWPLNMDGSEGPRCQATLAFVRNLSPYAPLPALLWDERMSTLAVERSMLEADLSRQRRAELVDKAAAAYILQGALDGLQALRQA